MTKTTEVPTKAPARVKALDQREIVALHNNTLQFLSAKMEPLQPQVGTVVQFLLVPRGGEYRVDEVEARLTKPLVSKPARPGKLAPQYSTWPPAELLRSAFGGPGESAFDNAPDDMIRKAAAKAATHANLQPNDARTLARAVTALLAVRAGMAAPTVFEAV